MTSSVFACGCCGTQLERKVLKGAEGYYLGYTCPCCFPRIRDIEMHWCYKTRAEAEAELAIEKGKRR